MAVETFPRSHKPSILERSISLDRVNWEVAAYLLIVTLSVIAHLWGLGRMALHHDESIHAWTSWRFYVGQGGFTCWGGHTSPTYCYDPVYHGPSLYVLTFLSYFLFGDGDAQARLPMALAGIGMVASCWWLRPYLGRRGALIAAVLLGFSPSLLYYTRFARHDGLMVLWELWMVIGVFRYLNTGRPAWLYLMSASIALAIATHELYYILFFIFGVFVLMRLIAESRFAARLNIVMLAVLGLCLVLMVLNPPLPIGQGLYLGEKAFLVASALLLGWLCQRVWSPEPILTNRLKSLWFENRTTLWIALAILVGIFVVLYTTFFTYPRGAIDGLYAGLAYWLGSQQDYARGDQPWYYYLIQLPLYEPLGLLSGIGMVIYLITMTVRSWRPKRRSLPAASAAGTDDHEPSAQAAPSGQVVADHQPNAADQEFVVAAASAEPDEDGLHNHTVTPHSNHNDRPTATPHPSWTASNSLPLFPLLLVFWYFTAIIIFSWAGEKMPWLTVHMALPGNLLAAWALSRLIRQTKLPAEDDNSAEGEAQARWRSQKIRRMLVPLAFALLVVALGVAFWRLQTPAGGQAAQMNLLQGLVPLVLAGALIYTLLTIGLQLGPRIVLSLIGLTVAGVLGVYMLRATWMVVYEHPDTPVDILVYVQTAPDIPRYVDDIRELAIHLTRNNRTSEDVTGSLSMPLIIDNGREGDGSLAWPLQWYLRDFQQVKWRSSDEFRNNPTPQTFEVEFPDGSMDLAPVVLLSRNSVTEETRAVLSENYVQPYGERGIFNWWFPEGDKCSPDSPGYKRFYFSTWTRPEELTNSTQSDQPTGCRADIASQVYPIWAPLVWPFQAENQSALWQFLLYRELPYPLVPGAREVEFWMRRDLASGSVASVSDSSPSGALVRLLAQQEIGEPGELTNPTGVVVDDEGNVYVADTQNHRVQIFDPQGDLIRTIGGPSFGSGPQQFYEPRGLAIDAQSNLYVADTWNARIVKFDPDGQWLASWGSGSADLGDSRRATITGSTLAANEADPLGFFGPRSIAIDDAGNVYIADTGNRRIVVTDSDGEYLYQLGYEGSELGAFNEPASIAIDGQGNLYVADVWNSRVQVFQRQADGQMSPIPVATWRVSGWRPNTYDDPAIAASLDGQVYVSVPSQNLVLAANLRGDIGLRWGGDGQDRASLNSPSGMAVGPEGDVYVVNRDSSRVLRFTLPEIQQ
jgi:uncharacterized protein (TIGR03663 family)